MGINVLIADGRKLLREGLTLLLDKYKDVEVVGEATDLDGAAKLIAPLEVRVLIINLPYPAHHGMTAVIRSLLSQHPSLRVVTIGVGASAHSIRETLTAGATGCLTKECASTELIAAIRAVAAGRRYLSPQLSDVIVSGYAEAANRKPSRPALSARETQVLQCLAIGKSTKETASALGVAAKTVETHRRRLMAKLDRHTIAELTQYALLSGLIAVPAASEL
ncbi:MAG TPA: response regulator transcription factor [Tepidisphaeraceae bacterium]|jgi:two-component system NarL family response regulator